MKKYSVFMNDVRRYISPYHFEEKPLLSFSEKLFSVGFEISHIEIRDQIFIYDDIELLKCKFLFAHSVTTFTVDLSFLVSVKAVNPFTSRMPETLQNDFLNDYVKVVEGLNLIRNDVNSLRRRVITPYKLMIAVAKKK